MMDERWILRNNVSLLAVFHGISEEGKNSLFERSIFNDRKFNNKKIAL